MNALSRRSVLAATPAFAAVALSGVALAALPEPLPDLGKDVELLDLERQLALAVQEWRIASTVEDETQGRIWGQLPPRPKDEPMPPEIESMFHDIRVGELARLRELVPDHPQVAAYLVWSDAQQERWNVGMDARDAQEKKLRRKYRLASKERASRQAWDKALAISSRMLAMPAATMAGVLVKLRMGEDRAWLDYDEGRADIYQSVVADLVRLVGADDVTWPMQKAA